MKMSRRHTLLRCHGGLVSASIAALPMSALPKRGRAKAPEFLMRWFSPTGDFIRPFADRRQAGNELAAKLQHLSGRHDVIVLALPRGGVPVAGEVADALGAPLDVFIVRKLGVPGHEELAMGAIASGGVRVINHEVVDSLGIPPSAIDRTAASEERELKRR